MGTALPTVATVLAEAAELEGRHGIATPVPLILIAAAAFALPLAAGRFRLPAIVLEIGFGVLIGPVLGWIDPGAELLGFLAEFGIFLLMFLAGFEIDFNRLERQGPTQVVTGVGMFALFGAAAWVGTGFLSTDGASDRLFITFLLAAASLGIVVPALRETGRGATRLGQTVLITAVFAEVLALVGIVGLTVVVEGGVGPRLLAIPALLLVMLAVLVGIRQAAWWHPEKFERLFRSDDPQEMGTRASIALLFVLVGFSALLGVEAILGAFLAGAIFKFVFREPGALEARLTGFSFGFFIPVFFINVGIEFPLSELADLEVLGQALVLIVVAFAAKVIPAVVLVTRRLSLRDSLAAGLLLAGQLSVIIALADLGLDLELLTVGQRAGAIMLVLVSAVISPVAFRILAPPLPVARSEDGV